MLAAAQLQRIGAGRPASRRTPRPANRLPRPKTAPGVFWRHSPQTRPMRSTQAAESHQEKWVFRYELAPGCAVAPNSTVSVTVQSYIAASEVDGFLGDGHGPTSSPSDEYRTSSTLTFDPSDPSSSAVLMSSTGTTVFLPGLAVPVAGAASLSIGQASASGLTGSVSTISPGVYAVVMTGAASNPLVPGAPPIAYGIITVVNQNTGSVGGYATNTQFPSFQEFVNGQSVYSSPESGTPLNLYNTVSHSFGTWPP